MNRNEGIIQAYIKHNGGKEPNNATQLIRTEYNNYTELCWFCNEEPLTFELWATEIIKETINN